MSIEKAPAFQFYPKDFLTDSHVVSMTLAQRGAYITLLSLMWLEKTIPCDMKILSHMTHVSEPIWTKQIWPALKPCFQVVNGQLVQPRLERERSKQEQYRAMKAEAGKKGGRPKAEVKQRLSRTKAKESPPSSSSSSSSVFIPIPTESGNGGTPPSQTREFLKWFESEYKKRSEGGAKYFVRWDKDGALVKGLLAGYGFERLKKLAVILLTTDEEWVEGTDRGVGILSAKINWLESRLAAWEVNHAPT